MSSARGMETLFWNKVLTASEAIEAADASLDAVTSHLLALEEGFRDVFDPADAFQAYVTVALCRSIRRTLERRGP